MKTGVELIAEERQRQIEVEKYDADLIAKTNRLGDSLREGLNSAFKRAGIKAQAIGQGSLVAIHWGGGQISNARDAATIYGSAKKLPSLFHLEMLNRGMYVAPRGFFCLSTPMTQKEIDQTLDESIATLEVLRPYIAEETPHLIS